MLNKENIIKEIECLQEKIRFVSKDEPIEGISKILAFYDTMISFINIDSIYYINHCINIISKSAYNFDTNNMHQKELKNEVIKIDKHIREYYNI